MRSKYCRFFSNATDSFAMRDKQWLCKNPFSRFEHPGHIIGNLVFPQDGQKKQYWQFKIPDAPSTPVWQPIEKISAFENSIGEINYRVVTNSGIPLSQSPNHYRLINRSKSSNHPYPYYDVILFAKPKTYNQTLLTYTSPQPFYPVGEIKGNQKVPLDTNTINARRHQRASLPTQNAVMGRSARQACAQLLRCYGHILADELIAILRHIILSPYQTPLSPEWLHALAFSMTPQHLDPQSKKNLGSATSAANTHMMVMERLAMWFAFKREYDIHCRSIFYTFLDSDVIEAIDYIVSIQNNRNKFHLRQHLEPFRFYPPALPMASDTAQLAFITKALLHDEPPEIIRVLPA